jgi:hypothetical protein
MAASACSGGSAQSERRPSAWSKVGLKNHGKAYVAALQACHDALGGELATEIARRAFIAAAREVDIFVSRRCRKIGGSASICAPQGPQQPRGRRLARWVGRKAVMERRPARRRCLQAEASAPQVPLTGLRRLENPRSTNVNGVFSLRGTVAGAIVVPSNRADRSNLERAVFTGRVLMPHPNG